MKQNEEQPKLRIVKYTNNGKPYTTFVALNTNEFADVIEANTGDLSNYKNKIISVVEGHDPTDHEWIGAREAFVRVHTNARGPVAVEQTIDVDVESQASSTKAIGDT